jgi:hypothetical protein
MADQANSDLQASQTGIDPITGSILSPETRKLLFKRSQMSSSSFLGGGRGSGIVPVNRGGPDSQTLAIVKAEETSIATLRQQINALVKRDDNFLAQVAQVSSIQQAQINGLSQTVIGLGAEFEAVRVSIINDALLEQQKDRQESEYEKQLAEQGLRQGKEKLLEQKIQNALMAPVRAIGNKVSGIFGNLMSFMWNLLGGWLTMQGLNTLKALATGDKKTLEQIKNNVIKALLVVGGSLLFIQFGLGKLIGSITKLGFNVAKFVFDNTIGRLFKLLGGLAKKALGLGGDEAPKPGGVKPGEVKPGEVKPGEVKPGEVKPGKINSGAAAAEEKGLFGGFGKGLKGMLGPVNIAFGGLDFLQRKSEGQTNVQAGSGAVSSVAGSEAGAWAGAESGAALGLLGGPFAEITVPAGALIGGIGGGIAGWWGGGKVSDTLTGVGKNQPTKAQTKPKNKAIPSKTPTPAKTPSANTASISSGTGEPESTSTPPAAQTSPPPAQTQSMPTPQQNLGQPTEPAPQVVALNSPQTQGSQTPQSSLRSGSATDIPLFPSGNTDNFYSLYAQVNYNVIL